MYNAALGLIYDFDPVKIVCFLLLNFIACGLIAKSIVTLNEGKTVSKNKYCLWNYFKHLREVFASIRINLFYKLKLIRNYEL